MRPDHSCYCNDDENHTFGPSISEEALSLSSSQGLADNAVISRVNGELWDLDRPLEHDCSLEILRFDNEDAQAVSTNNAFNKRHVNTSPGLTQGCFLGSYSKIPYDSLRQK